MFIKKSSYQILEDYCLRTPMFSFSFFEETFNSNFIDFPKILNNQIVREALYLGSPDLYKQLERWEKGGLINKQKIEKLKISVLKYCIRISARCTPFGLFASCSYGKFDNQTSINLGSLKQKSRVSNFDYTFLAELKEYILSDKKFRENLKFFPNSSIYKIGNNYRYIEYELNNSKRNYTLEGIRYSTYLENIIDYIKQGKTTTELIEFLSNDDIFKEEAEDYINELIKSQILVSELEITITGKDYFDVLISIIKNLPNFQEIERKLEKLKAKLETIDKSFGNDIDAYREVFNEAIEYTPNAKDKFLIQTDVFTLPLSNSLNCAIQKSLKQVFSFFNKITLSGANQRIVSFKKRFKERYGDEEILLNLALDIEVGLGYGKNNVINSSILSNINFNSESKKRYERIIWTDFDTIISEKLENAYKAGFYSIDISKEDIKDFPENNEDLPDTLAGIAEIYKTENDSKVFIKSLGGSSSNNLLGRFGNGSIGIKSIINKVTSIENNLQKDDLLAEIVHLPESRTGNILKRPSNRDYEIPYLAKSNLPFENQIPLNDIYISVKNDEIKLKSKRLNKYIQPRLGNAHNFSNSKLPIYLFLCELQYQKVRPSIGFSWNSIFLKNKFLPRVEYEGVIVSKARWKVKTKEFLKFTNNKNKKLLSSWKLENKIPDLVEFTEGDNKLLIDFNSEICIKILIDACNTKEYFILEEFLFTNDELVKDSEGKSYCNQFIFSFYKQQLDA